VAFMKRGLIWVAMLAMIAATACSGSPSGTHAPPSGDAAKRGHPVRLTKESPPPALMQVGTEVALGVVARYCEGTRCDTDAGARPARSLNATEQGLLLFVVKKVPRTARVEVFKGAGERAVMTLGLHAGTSTLAAHEELAPGTYVVRLTTGWAGHGAEWVFGLRVPAERD
jgi:hypothetical protein